MSIAPAFRTPFTDMMSSMFTHQRFGRCADFEMQMMECFEVYGLSKGREKCRDYMDDFVECARRKKQMFRQIAMIKHRANKEKEGTLTPEDRLEPPPLDAVFGTDCK